jgi:phosphatidylglycerophosphate synthase
MTIGNYVRDHRSLFAASERKLLIWIARRLPPTVHSDHLSGLGLASMVVVAVGFASMRLSPWGAAIVVIGLAANWFGDSLDGTVARVRGQERPRYGFYVDHVIDLAGTAALFAGLACSGLMTPIVAVAVLAGYLIVCAESFLATHVAGVFRMASYGIGPTELRIVLAAGALHAARGSSVNLPLIGDQQLFDVGGVVAIGGFLVTFADSALRQTRRLSAAEPRTTPNRTTPEPLNR